MFDNLLSGSKQDLDVNNTEELEEDTTLDRIGLSKRVTIKTKTITKNYGTRLGKGP